MFDGSSIAGWKAINEWDMTLMPDPATACMDPFFSAPTMSIVCDILEPATGEPYGRDPRGMAKKAEAYLKSTDRKSTRLNSSHANISYAVFCLKKKNRHIRPSPSSRL